VSREVRMGTRLILLIILLVFTLLAGCQNPISPQNTSPASTTVESATISTPEPPKVPIIITKEVELKSDDGNGETISKMFAAPNSSFLYAYLIDFTPPDIPFTIRKIIINGIAQYCPS